LEQKCVKLLASARVYFYARVDLHIAIRVTTATINQQITAADFSYKLRRDGS